MSEPKDILTDHEYDGIREYDNPTPGWWTWIFMLTIVYSFFYLLYYHNGAVDRSLLSSYDQAVADNLRLQFSEIGELEGDQATVLKYMNDEKWLKVGEIVYKGNCVSCHGQDAAGLVGPNLTDEHWKGVKKLTDIVRIVRDGAANGAMPPWKTRLHPNEVVLVSSYIASLRGKNLEGPRGPEGEVIPAWPKADDGE